MSSLRVAARPVAWGSLLLAHLLLAAPLLGQGSDLLDLEVGADGGVRVELGDVLSNGRILQALESGLPVRVRVVTELWRDRFFDAQEGREDWRATVLYDPLSTTFRVEAAENPIGTAEEAEDAIELLRSALRPQLGPDEPGTYYYLGRLEIETLSLSDVEELRRWLRGELAPAVDSDDALGSALGRGIRRIFVRALALPAIRVSARSLQFNWEG